MLISEYGLFSQSITGISKALVAAQKKMGGALKDAKNPFFKSNYADLGAVMEVCKEPLNENGVMILQPTYTDNGVHYVKTILLHESGEYISTLPIKLELKESTMQALGSAITYARRYQLQSLLSIPAIDDDGEAAMGPRKPAQAPAQQAQTANNPAPKAAAPAAPAAPAGTPPANKGYYAGPQGGFANKQAAPKPAPGGFGGED